MNKLYHLATYILDMWTYMEGDQEYFCDKYDVTYEEMQDLYGDFHDIIEKVFEEKEFKRIMRLIKKDKEE